MSHPARASVDAFPIAAGDGGSADVASLLERHRAQIDRLVRRLVDPADRDDVTHNPTDWRWSN